jgi:hypothetical protein
MKTLIKTQPAMNPAILIAEPQKKFYHDNYANVSLVDAVPCIKVKISGVAQSSDHYQQVHEQIIESVQSGKRDYFRLHLMTDNSKAGLMLEEDMEYYKNIVVPALEKSGIRYHAVVLPENHFLRIIHNQIFTSTHRLKVEFFNTLVGASKWLRNQ